MAARLRAGNAQGDAQQEVLDNPILHRHISSYIGMVNDPDIQRLPFKIGYHDPLEAGFDQHTNDRILRITGQTGARRSLKGHRETRGDYIRTSLLPPTRRNQQQLSQIRRQASNSHELWEINPKARIAMYNMRRRRTMRRRREQFRGERPVSPRIH